MKRKIISVVSLLLVCVLVLAACGGGSGSGTPSAKPSADATSAKPSAAPGSAAPVDFEYEKITFQIGHTANTDNHYHTTALAIAEEISNATKGNVKIDVYPSEQLGNGRDMTEAVKTNAQSMVFSPSAYMASYNGLFDVLEMPYLFSSFEDVNNFVGSEGYEFLNGIAEESGFVILGMCANGFHNVTSNRPIVEPGDMRGLKIRIGSAQLPADMWASLGATPVNISMGETYTAIDNGTVEAQANPYTNVLSHKLYEVQDYIALTRHCWMYSMILMNKDLYDGLSPELQQLLSETFAKYSELDREQYAKDEAAQLEELKANGMKVTEPDLKVWKAAMEPFYEQYNEKYGQEWANLMALITK